MNENEMMFCTILANSLDKSLLSKIDNINEPDLTNESARNHKTMMLLNFNNEMQETIKPYLNAEDKLEEEWNKLINNPANKITTIPKLI